jgi:hypothetical protein
MTGLEPGDTPETVFLRTRLDDSMVEQRWNALPFSPNQLYYPSWVFGEFRVTSVLRKKTLPFGQKASPLNLQRDGSFRCGDEEEGDELEVRARYFSTLADSLENNVRVNLGLGAPSASIIEDRAFNARELSAAVVEDGGQGVAGTKAATEAKYDPRVDATRLALFFSKGYALPVLGVQWDTRQAVDGL